MRQISVLFVFVFISLLFAQESTEEISTRIIGGLNNICIMLYSLLPILAIVLFVVAAVAYGAGQIFGAEMRSRATSWATTIVVGVIIALIIILLSRPIIQMFIPGLPSDFCVPPSAS